MNRPKQAMTLIELTIAITLMGFIFAAVAGIDIAVRRFLADTNVEADAINEISPAFEHMHKYITQANKIDPVVGNCSTGNCRVDIYFDDPTQIPSPELFSDDLILSYAYTNNQIIAVLRDINFVPIRSEILADNILFCDFNLVDLPAVGSSAPVPFGLRVDATSQVEKNPGSPEYFVSTAELQTIITMRCESNILN